MSVESDPQAALEECDAILRECAANASDPEVAKLVAFTLVRKAYSLAVLGDRGDARVLCAEVAERFGDSEDPDIREQVTFALAAHASLLLSLPDRLDAAIALTDDLLGRLWTEPTGSLGFLADTCLTAARRLMDRPNPPPVAMAILLTELAVRPLAPAFSRLPARARAPLASASRRLIPAAAVRQRKRGEQALKLCRAVQARLAEDDADTLAALGVRATVFAGHAQLFLGRLRDEDAGLEAWNVRDALAVSAAFERLAEEDSQVPGPFGRLAVLVGLRMRAESLVGGDDALARIAYDESVAMRLPRARSRTARLFVRLFRP